MTLTVQQIETDKAELRAEIPVHTWARIPEYMHDGLALWILYGIPPGDFLSAVLCNDLREACLRADDTNKLLIYDYVKFLYNHAPIGSWGGPMTFEGWKAQGGMKHYKRELT